MKKQLSYYFLFMLIFQLFNTHAQVNTFPYICGFETGVDGIQIVGNEASWDGSDQWIYDDYISNVGLLCAKSSINTTGDDTRNLYLELNFSGETGIKPSFYYKSTSSNIYIQVVGQVDGSNWVVLKDWFIPVDNIWTEVNYSELSSLSVFDNQASSKFGIRAKKNTGTATLRLDDFQIVVDNTNLWKLNASTNDWNTSSNWYISTVPSSTIDIAIPYVSSFSPVVGTANAICKNINILPNGNLDINSGYTLTVNGNLTIQSNSSGNGSFINNGNLTMAKKGIKTVERHIAAYAPTDNGWHLLSSPVSNFSINGSDFAPGDNDDFYRWDEETTIWENWKTTPGDFTTFVNGNGYLVAYEATSVKEFIGNLNSTDITFSNLTLTGDSDNGWHLLGNPFPSALIWNDANWTITNFSGVAKIWNESAGNYTSIEADGFIPATQGFFVQASNSTNTITIPANSRTHDSQNFYKNSFDVSEKLELIATGDINTFSDKCIVGFRENASLAYDLEFDSHKLFGSENAPQLYSIISDEENLSINYLPQSSKNNTVQLGFEVGISGIYSIEANNLDSFDTLNQIILEDFLTGFLHDFRQDSIYSFYADIDDDKERFLLHFKNSTKINEKENPDEIQVWAHGKNIYIKNKSTDNKIVYYYVCDILGQEIIRGKINGKSDIIIPMKVKTGNYIIRITGNINYSKKLFLH